MRVYFSHPLYFEVILKLTARGRSRQPAPPWLTRSGAGTGKSIPDHAGVRGGSSQAVRAEGVGAARGLGRRQTPV